MAYDADFFKVFYGRPPNSRLFSRNIPRCTYLSALSGSGAVFIWAARRDSESGKFATIIGSESAAERGGALARWRPKAEGRGPPSAARPNKLGIPAPWRRSENSLANAVPSEVRHSISSLRQVWCDASEAPSAGRPFHEERFSPTQPTPPFIAVAPRQNYPYHIIYSELAYRRNFFWGGAILPG